VRQLLEWIAELEKRPKNRYDPKRLG